VPFRIEQRGLRRINLRSMDGRAGNNGRLVHGILITLGVMSALVACSYGSESAKGTLCSGLAELRLVVRELRQGSLADTPALDALTLGQSHILDAARAFRNMGESRQADMAQAIAASIDNLKQAIIQGAERGPAIESVIATTAAVPSGYCHS
jgi:hypothetical protein